ncbi:class I adenylate-forming enzyme family protein [Gracilimonas mengyeensis]|uniref:2-succinylbenzoyl-CoA synthetase n=1 Tax=Gracilimonas mengyeensis TaxID=1302730 RepID=A0A521ADK8_9BACT|nr:AMP-binding protein [Gracilimonas mengyeensis]SMO32904.1 2-succinylbenzoyl-CoA synthetase [Gracilimonas mengyeensis]
MFKSRLHKFEFKKKESPDVFLSSQHGMYTYNDLNRFTAFFKDLVDTKTEGNFERPVVFISESSDMLLFSIAACWKLGIPFTPISPKTKESELKEYLNRLDPSLIFCDVANRQRLDYPNVVKLDENFFLNAFTQDVRHVTLPDPEEISDEQLFGYFFTSGTTSKPKIVPLKRRQMISAAEASALNFRPDPNHFWLLCLPLNHIGGISIILRSLIYGTSVYRLGEFDEEMVKEFLSENPRFQAASLVPTMLKRLLDDPLFNTHHEFKSILLGGGPSSENLIRKSVERGIPIVASYGMTETCAQIVANPMLAPSGMYTPLKSVGKPFPPNVVQVRDDDGKALGKNQSGQLWLRGPQVFDGYLDPSQNEGRFDNEGWFNTGDYGHLNGFGQLFIESRRTDLIITGGENVNPTEVEEAVRKIGTIKDAVVIGLPDEEWGQKVTAVVTLKNGETPQLTDVRSQLKDTLVDFKIPRELKIVQEFPLTATGKVKRWELVKKFK